MAALRRATLRASGLMSQAWTFAEGRFLARARAMQPLPVPISRMVGAPSGWDVGATWGWDVGATLCRLVVVGLLVGASAEDGVEIEASIHSTSSSVSGRGIRTFSSTYSFIPANQLSCRTYCTGRWARSSRE